MFQLLVNENKFVIIGLYVSESSHGHGTVGLLQDSNLF